MREQPSGKQHVEVPEVADDDGVRPVVAPRRSRRDRTTRPNQHARSRQPSSGSIHGRRSIGPGRRWTARAGRCTPARSRRAGAARRAGRRPGGAPPRRRCRRTGGASRATLDGLEWRVRAGSVCHRIVPVCGTRGSHGALVHLQWCGADVPPAPPAPRCQERCARPAGWCSPSPGRPRARARPRRCPGGRLPALGRRDDPAGDRAGRCRVPRRRLGPRPGHEPVRRAGCRQARLLGSTRSSPATTRVRRSSPARCRATSGSDARQRLPGRRRGGPGRPDLGAARLRRPAAPDACTVAAADRPRRHTDADADRPRPGLPAGQPRGTRWQLKLDDATTATSCCGTSRRRPGRSSGRAARPTSRCGCSSPARSPG